MSRGTSPANEAYLADISDFEHLLIVERFLRLDDTWEVYKFRRVGIIPDVKYCSSRVYTKRDYQHPLE